MSIIRMKLEPGAPTRFSGEINPAGVESVVDTEAPSFVVGEETPTTGEDLAPAEE